MKKYLIPTVLVLSTIAIMAYGTITVYNTKTFPNSSTRSDTSSIIDLKGAEIVEIQTSVTGTDSIKISYKVDGYIAGKWVPNVYTDSLILDNSATTPGRGQLLRGYGTNNIKGCERIRVRNVLQAGGSDDSSSATSYSQYIIYR